MAKQSGSSSKSIVVSINLLPMPASRIICGELAYLNSFSSADAQWSTHVTEKELSYKVITSPLWLPAKNEAN
jgi:ABC-type cobalt transport system substrate-binding protein